MKKGKTKKLNFTTLARRTLASALSLSMIFSANVMTFAAGDAKEAVATGSVVDFSKAGVVVSTGNAATFNGTEVTFGTAAAAEEDVHGVMIENPYKGDKTITSEKLSQALNKTGLDMNAFVYRTTGNIYGNPDVSNGPATDRFYIAPYASVEEAQAAASDSPVDVEIVESLEDLKYVTRENYGQMSVTSGAVTYDAKDPKTYVASYAGVTMTNNNKKSDCFEVTYEGATIWINKEGKLLEQEPEGDSSNGYKATIKEGNTTVAMTSWVDMSKADEVAKYANSKITIMNLAQIRGEGTSSTALSFIYPTWENGVSISAWVKASSEEAAPIFTFMDKNLGYEASKKKGYGGLTFMTDGQFRYSPGTYGEGKNWFRNGRYEVTFGTGAVPAKNVGQWVHVTINFKNDGAEVYYNGVKSEITDTTVGNNSGGSQYFNHGYPVTDKSSFKECMEYKVHNGMYAEKLTTSFTGETKIKQVSKEAATTVGGLTEEQYYDMFTSGKNSDDKSAVSLMEYITRDTTNLYIGGATGTAKQTGCFMGYAGAQNDACVGMSVKDIIFNKTLKTADEISAEFGEVTAVKTVSDAAIETTNASALASYDYKVDDEENVSGVKNLYDELNGAAYSKDEKNNTVIKLGEVPEGENPKGVEINNPFVRHANVKETIAEALTKTGLTLDAWTYLYDDPSTPSVNPDYYRVANKSNKVDAGVEYASKQPSLADEYERKQVEAYAKAVEATTPVAVTTVVSGNATIVTATSVQSGVTMTVADVILAKAQIENNNMESTFKNVDNLMKAYVNDKAFTTEKILEWANGDITSAAECVEANKLGKTFAEQYPQYATNPLDTAEHYSYPYPTWSKGVTLGVWVKAATDAAANVFEFTDNTATLNFKADGTLVFKAGTSGGNAANTYQAKFDGDTPASKAGKWVYVSFVIKNDNIDVYYNGVKAEKTMLVDLSKANYFNYGTGYATDDTAGRIATMAADGRYQDVLKNFGKTTDYSDFSKYNMQGADGAAGVKDIMTFLTSVDTTLYLGGSSAQAPYSDLNAGMEIGTFNFYDVLSNDTMVAKQFADAKSIRETGVPVVNPSGDPVVPSGDPVNPSGDPVNPSGDPVNPSGDPVNPSNDPVNPSNDPVNPSNDPVNPSNDPVNPSNDPVNPSNDPVNPSDDPVKPSEDAAFLAGDADCNKKVELADAKIVLKLAVGIDVKVSEQGKKNADYDKNGSVNLEDAKYTLKKAVGIPFTVKK